ncbi:type IV toxin-antitoxin system AbiEi family antitoxin domain-containing protein [Actinomycetospora sp.]|uniref:type IV toxin-antitoxin system AbiEi family antitoxin domain-containing protein n=1 Tax=Actinomycetospora sp. TaxID=1872135 RepID=UPI002F40ABAF
MDIQRFLATHDGVISRAQAHACGLSDDQIAWKVATGEWIRRAPGVYFAVAWPWAPAARVRVAAEWVRPVGALVGMSAAWWLGLGVASPHPVTVTAPPGSRRRAPSGVYLVRRDLRGDRIEYRGLWVASKALATLDAAVALGRDGQAFLDRVLQQRVVTLEELRATQARHLGRRGSATAHRLLVQAGDRAASEPERRFVALLRRGGIAGWRVNLEVTLTSGREAILDVAFPAVRFAIEVDGWAFHSERDRFVRDRSRKRALVADGWTVVEVTWDDLVNRPGEVLDEVRRTLARLGAVTR